MSHFAQIDENNIVVNIIVAEQDFIDSGAVGDPSTWIQTSYNTFAGDHNFGKQPIRKNYASVGYTYDKIRDAFIPPKPSYDSWILNEEKCLWEAPVPYPTDGKNYRWDEPSVTWIEIVE